MVFWYTEQPGRGPCPGGTGGGERLTVAGRGRRGPNGVEGGPLGSSGPGLAARLIGVACMKESGQRRAREMDELAAACRRQGVAMPQAFPPQGHALDRQGRV